MHSGKSGLRKILAFGDSLTEGYFQYGMRFHPYTLKLAELFSKNHPSLQVEIVNAGISGETTDEMVHRYRSEIAGRNFTHCIILGGTNDLGARNPDAIVDNLKRLHSMALEDNIVPFAVTIPEMQAEESVSWISDVRSRANAGLQAFCASKGIDVIDLATKIPYVKMPAAERKLMWDDGLHLKPAGYDRLAEIIYETIRVKVAE